MDIAGAKALKKRLGQNETADTWIPPAYVREDLPPIYHWLGVGQSAPDAPAELADDDPQAA